MLYFNLTWLKWGIIDGKCNTKKDNRGIITLDSGIPHTLGLIKLTHWLPEFNGEETTVPLPELDETKVAKAIEDENKHFSTGSNPSTSANTLTEQATSSSKKTVAMQKIAEKGKAKVVPETPTATQVVDDNLEGNRQTTWECDARLEDAKAHAQQKQAQQLKQAKRRRPARRGPHEPQWKPKGVAGHHETSSSEVGVVIPMQHTDLGKRESLEMILKKHPRLLSQY
ncbi:hypothetical protein RND71_016089 [Anisodus tanguticus]|uniref:Uncharacterized protein n=1 Tax=Anisodus tanguticus TaxID=243964 RepID=A0AAE1S969_9SOLA|nr:hypothetical protein RND71_016089 [Anisodus tanguticus]